MNWKLILLVALGGALGALLRFFLQRLLNGPWAAFPLGILTINILGCFFMGLIIEIIAQVSSVPSLVQIFLVTGFLGGFTTFSSFTLEFFTLMNRHLLYAFVYLFCTLALSLLGFWLAKKIVQLVIHGLSFIF